MSVSERHGPPPQVLVATLDWGLGHSTRMVPLIRALLRQGAEVDIASSGPALMVLRREFPALDYHELPSYGITYQSGQRGFAFALLRQAPRILRAIRREQARVARLQDEEDYDLIISDNRFGARARDAFNVFITHQVFIRTPAGLKWASPLLNTLNGILIRRFDTCWIPDFGGKVNLSGALSHGLTLPKRFRYIGLLSRFSLPAEEIRAEPDLDLLVILSGPEPQRSRFEEVIHSQLMECDIHVKMVRGLPDESSNDNPRPGYYRVAYEDSEQLQASLLRSNLVLCRSGYSSLMDLILMQKEAILVPTPGQTEQEYLARRLKRHRVFYSESQDEFNLIRSMEEARHYSIGDLNVQNNLTDRAVAELLSDIKAGRT
jgi:UDP:flavonoid glycosyltransferase YjiC (YdhE family)